MKKRGVLPFSKSGTERKFAVQVVVLAVLLILTGILIFTTQKNTRVPAASNGSSSLYVSAEVLQVLQNNASPDAASGGRMVGDQKLKIQILEGTHKNEVLEVANYLSALHNVYAKQGSHIVVRVDTQTNGSYTASVYNYDRKGTLYGLVAAFLLLLCLTGGRKGVMSMLGLFYTVIFLIFYMLPMLLNGGSPVWTAVIVCVLSAAVCFVLLDGINRKTISAMLGTVCGVILASIAALIAGTLASLNGYNMQEAESLLLQIGSNKIKIDGLLAAGIMVSSLGAVMDIAISISSSVHEIYQTNPKLNFAGLFRSGMNIGRDAMGTMANTLILAFAGSSLNMLVLIYSYGIPFSQLINTDLIGIEIMQGIAASLGVVLTVPLVTLISARIILIKTHTSKELKKSS